MLDHFTPSVRGLILDMDGVLWKDNTPIGDLNSTFNCIRASGLQVTLATNNATRTVQEYVEKLHGFGVRLEPLQIVTSAEATAHVLVDAFPDRGFVYVIGENGICSALREQGFEPIQDPDDASRPVAVVVGLDRTVTYPKLRRATLHVRAGVPLYGTNPDKTFPTPEGLVPGAGSVLAAVVAATDGQPIVVGKPAPFMLELAAERMGLGSGEVLIVGDRLETDIAGGQSMGARTALVLSGVNTRQDGEAWNPRPDLIAVDLAELVGAN